MTLWVTEGRWAVGSRDADVLPAKGPVVANCPRFPTKKHLSIMGAEGHVMNDLWINRFGLFLGEDDEYSGNYCKGPS